MELHQVDCFKMNMRFWRFLAIWPDKDSSQYYKYYSIVFITIIVVIYDLLFTVNFYFMPRQLDVFVEEMIFYFTELAVTSKVLTFVFMRDKITELTEILETEVFQPANAECLAMVEKSKKFIRTYWKIVAAVSVTSNLTHVLSPLMSNLILGADLMLPVCSFSFLSKQFKQRFIYPLYLYQALGMHFHMLYNMNIDSFFLGLMVLTIAQLDILDNMLRKVTDDNKDVDSDGEISRDPIDRNQEAITNINKCITHFNEVSKFCELIEDVFSVTLFIQFSMASCIICVCLFRFTMPAPFEYYIFLATYMFVMIIQIMVPCWFGTRIMDKTNHLAFSTYSCDWTPRSRRFKSNLRLFVERVNKPISITGGKMFCLSLNTFTSIMNSAYSFFTLLQHMQSQK